MQCLIIAAGQGTRLRSVAPSKPLARVRGVPLIEHIVRAARAGGATGFVVATGYEPAPLEAFLDDLGERLGCPIQAVRNPQWERPNGFSVLAAAQRLAGPFALLMSDHLFDPDILAALIAGRPAEAALTLAVDRGIDNPDIDLDDATKVVTAADGRILRIGKTIEGYDAIDTGIFLATPELPQAIARSVEAGGAGSLSEGVQTLADAGRAFTFDIGTRWWLDVDDAPAMAKAEAGLPEFGI
jgi:1L-myo-inositol 1-phosphate cytidylyltransferase